MRLAILPLAILGLCGPALAADLDYDYLRGAEYDREPILADVWSGAYLGGHGGYTSAALGYKSTLSPLVYGLSHDTTAESIFGASTLLNPPARRVGDASFGAFVGYNVQFGEIVLGVEADYTAFGAGGVSSDAIGLSKMSDKMLDTVQINGTSATKINDYGTLRARAGYAFGDLLPYVTAGVAIGRARVADTVRYRNYGFDVTAYNANQAGTSTYINNYGYSAFNAADPASSIPYTSSVARTKTKVVAGVALGAGLEYAITPNILLRGEYQYVLFEDFDGHKANLNTVRGGAAVKF